MKVAEKTYYLNADKSEALAAKSAPKKLSEGEVFDETPDGAAFLLVREGQEVTAEMEEKYGVKGTEREEAQAEPGVVLSDVGGDQGFVSASEVQRAGGVVTDADEAGDAENTDAAKPAAKKAGKKSGK